MKLKNKKIKYFLALFKRKKKLYFKPRRNFEHFSFRVAENEKYIYYINTLGWAFSKNKDTGAQYILNPTLKNQVSINGKMENLAKLIYKTVYSEIIEKNGKLSFVPIKIEKIIFLDGNQKNCNIENLANIPKKSNEFAIFKKNNNNGKCVEINLRDYLKNLIQAEVENKLKQIVETENLNMFKTKDFTFFQKQKQQQAVVFKVSNITKKTLSKTA